MEYIILLVFVFTVCGNLSAQLAGNSSGQNGSPNTGFFSRCCPDVGGSKSFTQEEIEMHKQCYNDAIKEGLVANGQPIYDCVTQCYGEKKGMVDREGLVNPDEFLQQVLQLYTDESIKNVVRTVAPKCAEHCNAHAKAVRAKDPDTYSCSPAMTFTNLCTYVDIQLKCPAAITDTSEECENLRKSMLDLKNAMFP